ncbi:MAG TPA: hypothetical protein PLX39_04065, partial [Pyrinomonadaceae bacterium]|nr:hypothetical protein [Pyrinomonadaceae bacterium]
FRLSRAELDTVETKFDWVINARRSILLVKLEKPLAEFRSIVNRVAGGERSFQLDRRRHVKHLENTDK